MSGNLGVTYAELRRRIGRHLGWGRNPAKWTSEKSDDCEDILRTGLRKFYWPIREDGRPFDHEWSFLKITGSIVTESGKQNYDLPTDFGDIDGPFFYSDFQFGGGIDVVGIKDILSHNVVARGFGRPLMAALVPTMVNQQQQTWRVSFSPIPESVYEIGYAYRVLPEALLDTTREHPYGGAMFAEAIIHACLAAAEFMIQDAPGPYEVEFRRQLMAAIHRDGRANNPETFGYNGDRSDLMQTGYGPRRPPRHWSFGRVRYVGGEG